MILYDYHWELTFTDVRGRERLYKVLDVGILAAMTWHRSVEDGAIARSTADLLSQYVVEGDWHSLTLPDAVRLASRVVIGEATEGKSEGSGSGPA